MAQLKAEQYVAIEWLSVPNKGGKTYEEVAAICGVTARTIENWRKDRAFDVELKRAMVRNNSTRLPEMIASLTDVAIKEGNAAAAKLVLQMNDMLTDRVALDTNVTETTDVNALRDRIKALQVGPSEPSGL
ncbi:putative transcriptional regulator [Paenibacillus sp. DS2015]|uniref:phBC6A51 family helix-turn-helix protein n=1 Tax=Paenibacillus sp. DS2015 TaxID=3373917 RepID=UPI003D1B4979